MCKHTNRLRTTYLPPRPLSHSHSLTLFSTSPPSVGKTNIAVDSFGGFVLFPQSLFLSVFFLLFLSTRRAVVSFNSISESRSERRAHVVYYVFLCRNVREFIRHLTPCPPRTRVLHTYACVQCVSIRSPFTCTTHKHKYVLGGFVAPVEYKSLFARVRASLFSKYKTQGACYVYSLVYYSRRVVYA